MRFVRVAVDLRKLLIIWRIVGSVLLRNSNLNPRKNARVGPR